MTSAQPGNTWVLTNRIFPPEVADFLAAKMDAVEKLLDAELNIGEGFITEKVRHLAMAGGKRFRPMFALLASQFGDRPGCEEVIKAATVVEMTHLATLYHDDVMDEADKRRGVISANARWDNSIAILAGDFLLARASCLMAQLGTPTVAHFADTFGTLVTGQMRETIGPGDGDRIAHYRSVIEEKTGVLIASAGYLGALHGGADEKTQQLLKQLGAAVGMIFQIVDDIIDIFSDTSASGKTPGTDLKEGVFTLPVLYAMAEDSPAGRALREELSGPVTSEDKLVRVLGLIKQSGGRDRCLEEVATWRARAERTLAALPDTPTRRALDEVIDLTISRVG